MGQLSQRIFQMISERGEATVNELSVGLEVDVLAVGRILRVLEREGAVEVARGPEGASVRALPEEARLGPGTYVRISRRLIDEISALDAGGPRMMTSNQSLASAIEGQMTDRDPCL
jgi:hypothetical protein